MKLNGKEYNREKSKLLRSDPIPIVIGIDVKDFTQIGILGAAYEEKSLLCYFAFREIWLAVDMQGKHATVEAIVGYVSHKGVYTRAEDIDDFVFKKYHHFYQKLENNE